MKLRLTWQLKRKHRSLGFSVEEVLSSISLVGILATGLITGYVNTSKQAQWASLSQAANSLASQKIEQIRSAKWDRLAVPAVDNITTANFPLSVQTMDLPVPESNPYQGTNYVSIVNIATTPPMKLVTVSCVWGFLDGKVYTNTVTLLRTPDQ